MPAVVIDSSSPVSLWLEVLLVGLFFFALFAAFLRVLCG
jgi:hypothetical protein